MRINGEITYLSASAISTVTRLEISSVTNNGIEASMRSARSVGHWPSHQRAVCVR